MAVIIRLVLALAVALAISGHADAQQRRPTRDVPISAFFGQFAGSGLAESQDNAYFGVTVRDLDVRIAPAGDGFVVTWTTVLREGGEPGRPNVRRRTQTLAFAPGQIAGQYRGTESGDPLNGGRMVWARLAGQTLTIYSLEFGEGGRYEMETYARTLVGTGMDLNYSRVSEGERVRGVKGRLVKQAN